MKFSYISENLFEKKNAKYDNFSKILKYSALLGIIAGNSTQKNSTKKTNKLDKNLTKIRY